MADNGPTTNQILRRSFIDADNAIRVSGTISGSSGTEYTEDAALPGDPIGRVLIARRTDTPAATVTTDGDAIALNATNKGELYIKHLDSIAVTGTFFQATQPVSIAAQIDTELPAAAALADTTSNPTTTSVGTFNHGWSGTNWDRLRCSGDNADALGVSGVGHLQTIAHLTFFNGTEWDRARGTIADGLLVNLGANNDVTVTGSVTANAGTNLNTSLLALESGGNLAGAATSLAIIDDWDESDRAKVNPIVGSAGVQGASGVVTASTQRVVLATDVALPSGTNVIGAVTQSGSWSLAANQSVNVAQINGVTPLMGNGVTGTGSHRVTIASDNTAFSVNAIQSGTWNIGTVTTVTSLTQMNGAAISMNTGVRDAGTQRVTIATNDVVPVSQSGSWSLAANQSVNVAQINGVTPLMGNGVTGTGSQRVTIASDNTAFSVNSIQSGTWNIGTVTTVTAVTAITNALPAGTNTIGGTNPTPSGAAAQACTNATSTAYEASRVVKASAGTVYGITGYNSKTTSQFVQLHNTTSLPADTAIPVVVFTVAPSSNFSIDFGVYGRRFSTGITICNSSTGPTKSIGSADVWYDVQYV